MRVTSKGQITIPKEIRDRAGLLPDTEVEFAYDGKVVTLRRSPARGRGRGARLVEHLGRHRGDVAMTTDEIMALTRDE